MGFRYAQQLATDNPQAIFFSLFCRTMLRHLLFVVFIAFAPLILSAQQFDFNANCRQAYQSLMALELNQAKQQIQLETKQHPGNAIPILLENYHDFLTIYTLDTWAAFEQRKKQKEVRIELLAAGDQSSPYYYYSMAEVHVQWAALNIRFGEYLSAIFDIKRAYGYLSENQKRFPDFQANNKPLGLLYALIGSVPDKYKWGLNLLGLDGNVDQGLNRLKNLLVYSKTNDFIFKEETATIYSFLLFHLKNDKEAAWQTLQEHQFSERNRLQLYALAHVGIYGKHNEEAKQLLQQSAQNFGTFHQLNYLFGLAKIHTLDTTAADNIKRFLTNYKGDNHLKSAYQKLGWCALLNKDTANYYQWLNKAENLGNTMVEADKQAAKEAASNKVPNIQLLQARLLFDGAYYDKAFQQINQLDEQTLTNTALKTEYYYRKGRILHEWNKLEAALLNYDRTMATGKNLPLYFAANASFESGQIWEKKGDTAKAKEYYQNCLAYPEHEYKNSIDQKAKVALSRIK